jgi:hypothetical protein
VLWRRAALLARVAAVADPALPFLVAYDGLCAAARLAALPAPADRRATAAAPAGLPEPARLETVALVSRKGSRRFGGAEHFLHEAGPPSTPRKAAACCSSAPAR